MAGAAFGRRQRRHDEIGPAAILLEGGAVQRQRHPLATRQRADAAGSVTAARLHHARRLGIAAVAIRTQPDFGDEAILSGGDDPVAAILAPKRHLPAIGADKNGGTRRKQGEHHAKQHRDDAQ